MKVLIIEAQIKQYRFPFYQRLFAGLRDANIELRVGYSDPPPAEASKKDACDLPAEYGVKVEARWLLGERVVFQPLLRHAMEADLVVVDEGNRYLLNHLLLPLSCIGLRRLAFWGLAENRQDGQLWISEWYRRNTLNWVSWWFAYTEGTGRYLQQMGVPSWKITVVDNAVDTRSIRQYVDRVEGGTRAAWREDLGIPASAPVGIYCGGLFGRKLIPILIESAKAISAKLPSFHLILVGSGPDAPAIEQLVRGIPWIHFTGPSFGETKAKLLSISDVFLIPGAVGLAILDAFAASMPLVTTRVPFHGPEIEYLKQGVNGLITEPTVLAFAECVTSLFANQDLLNRLRSGARAAGERYTIENMAANFQAGIQASLGVPGQPRVLAAQTDVQF